MITFFSTEKSTAMAPPTRTEREKEKERETETTAAVQPSPPATRNTFRQILCSYYSNRSEIMGTSHRLYGMLGKMHRKSNYTLNYFFLERCLHSFSDFFQQQAIFFRLFAL